MECEIELQEGMQLAKCKKCSCMKDILETADNYFTNHFSFDNVAFHEKIKIWHSQIQPIEYYCLGCKHCYAAVASNDFYQNFEDSEVNERVICEAPKKSKTWPVLAGEYFALCNNRDCPVAVTTLASIDLAEKLASISPEPLCIVGKTETENIGIDKIIKNIISNKTIRYLIVTGKEPEGHKTGETILAFMKNGVDANNKIIGSTGKRPILQNVTQTEIKAFREQVSVIDLIGCTDENLIVKKINELGVSKSACGCKECSDKRESIQIDKSEIVTAKEPTKIELDKNGYFVIYPQSDGQIIVEHYANNNKFLRTISGKNTREIYWTIIENGWVTQLSHAAYLGKELTKAELSIEYNFKYIQDKA